jgi:hypothetical protein
MQSCGRLTPIAIETTRDSLAHQALPALRPNPGPLGFQAASKLDAISDYRTSPVFSDKERAALEFATELTELRHVSPTAFETLSRHYSEREICEIVWVVATENLSNISNLGLGIGSDGLCEVSGSRQSA